MKNVWVSVSGATAQQRNVETIANNVANANTPGFKKDRLVFKEYLTALEKGIEDIDIPNKEWRPEDFYHSQGAENSYVNVQGSFSIHEQGALTPTGNPLDLGISGKGFFEVLTPNGPRYTRKGIFSLSKNGELITDKGYKVLSKRSDPVEGSNSETNLTSKPEERVIKIPPGPISISLDGQIFVSGTKVSDLSIIEFHDVNALRKEGDTLFINRFPENSSSNMKATNIYQGFVEESNVNAISEMANLISANRQFQNLQNAIKTYDNLSGRAVNDISKF